MAGFGECDGYDQAVYRLANAALDGEPSSWISPGQQSEQGGHTVRYVNFTDPDLFISDNIDDDIKSHPGMISSEERSFLYNLTKNNWKARGYIVDGGAFLGVSTKCFYKGIRDGAASADEIRNLGKPIRSYEQVVATHTWEMQRTRMVHKKFNIKDVKIGDSFADELIRFTENMDDLVDMNIGDIMNVKSFDGEIEILFLDILKSPEIRRHCAEIFYPKLLENSYVIQQDYNQPNILSIKVFQEYMSDNFNHVGSVRSTSVFKLKKTIDVSVISEFFENPPSSEEQYALHEKAESHPNSDARKLLMRCSRCKLMIHFKDFDKAAALINDTREKFGHLLNQEIADRDGFMYSPRMRSEVENIENILKKKR